MADAEDAMRRQPPDFNRADHDFQRAIAADRYYVRPWLGYADLAYRAWDFGGGRSSDQRWKTIPELLQKAVSLPRNPNAWALHLRRAETIRQLLRRVGSDLKPADDLVFRGEIVKETRIASRLYPTNAMLHARLAEASAEVSMFGDAVKEAEEALRLDRLTPHLDKKLPGAVRQRLEDMLPEWKEQSRR